MAPTWGISGPTFLVIWLVLAAAAVSLPVLLTRPPRPGRAEPDTTLTPQQLGALVDGPDRALVTGIAGLIESDRLRVGDDHKLTAVVGAGRPEDDPALGDLDVAVLRTAASPRKASGIVRDLRDDPVVVELDGQLVARGLLQDPERVRRRRRWAWAPFVAVVVLGLVRLGAGLAHGASVGFLVVLLVFAAVAARVVSRWATSSRVRTATGEATVRAAQAAHAELRATAHRSPTPAASVAPWVAGAALLVAVGGFAAFPDDELAAHLLPGFGGGLGGSVGGGWIGGGDVGGGSSCGGGGSSCGGGGGCGGGGCGG